MRPCPRDVDLNADLGEEVTDDDGLLAVVTSANVACGFHAGDPGDHAGGLRRGRTTRGGDRCAGVLRRPGELRPGGADVAPRLLTDQVAEQVGDARPRSPGPRAAEVAYLKPHGALYNRVADDEEPGRGGAAPGRGALPVLGMPGSAILAAGRGGGARRACTRASPTVATPTTAGWCRATQPGALVTDPVEIAARAVAMAADVDSVCVHGDSPGAVEHRRAVRRALEAAGHRRGDLLVVHRLRPHLWSSGSAPVECGPTSVEHPVGPRGLLRRNPCARVSADGIELSLPRPLAGLGDRVGRRTPPGELARRAGPVTGPAGDRTLGAMDRTSPSRSKPRGS